MRYRQVINDSGQTCPREVELIIQNQERALQKQIFQQAFGKISQLFTKSQDVVKLSDTEEKEWNESCAAVVLAEVRKVEKKREELLANRDVGVLVLSRAWR